MATALTRLRSAVGRLGSSRARAFCAAAAEAEAEAAAAAGPCSDSRAFAAVAAGSGLGIWLLSSNPQPLVDSGQAEDTAAAGGGGNSGFPAAFGGVGATGEREGRFLFGGEHPWLNP